MSRVLGVCIPFFFILGGPAGEFNVANGYVPIRIQRRIYMECQMRNGKDVTKAVHLNKTGTQAREVCLHDLQFER